MKKKGEVPHSKLWQQERKYIRSTGINIKAIGQAPWINTGRKAFMAGSHGPFVQ